MGEKISADALYGRVYQEISRRSDAQEKATQFNLVALSALFGWFFSGLSDKYMTQPVVLIIVCLVNFTFALKWLSEDSNIAGLVKYLREQGTPLESWQKANFKKIYPLHLRWGDLFWRLLVFFFPGTISLYMAVRIVAVNTNTAGGWEIIGVILGAILWILVSSGFVVLLWPWEKPSSVSKSTVST